MVSMNNGVSAEIEPQSEFDLLARYYELDQGGITDDIPFYLHLAQRFGSPILELGCGTGRILAPLAEAGYNITGIDVAPAMLDIARERVVQAKLEAQVALVLADMRSVELPERYGLAICGLNTLMHAATLKDQLAVIQTAYRHLKSGGGFVVEVLNPHRSAMTDEQTPLLLEKEMVDPETGHHVLKLFSQRVDLATQVADITLIYDEVDAQGGVHRTLVPMEMRWLYPYEARLLMEAAGFHVDAIYGSFDMEPFDAQSERMILIGRVP